MSIHTIKFVKLYVIQLFTYLPFLSAHAETGATVKTAITVLKEHGVQEKNIFLVTLFSTPRAAVRVLTQYLNITMLTSEVHEDSPSHFSQKYFGSD